MVGTRFQGHICGRARGAISPFFDILQGSDLGMIAKVKAVRTFTQGLSVQGKHATNGRIGRRKRRSAFCQR